ncbi:MAG TPA: hypothetical protein DDW50_13155 [Firmicutes bacterium]|jgi:glutamyl-tRNA reductase|nr:hypothetical protein [Bacillota bacterium]
MAENEGLQMIGINFHSAPPEYRKLFHLTFNQLTEVYQQDLFPAETLILSTCNRTEFYFYANRSVPFCWELLKVFTDQQSVKREFFYQYSGQEVIFHLLELSTGLRSMIIGETEILGQIAGACEVPGKLGRETPILSALFKKTLQFARRIRVQSLIGKHSTSLTTLMMKELKHHFDDPAQQRVLVLGNGEIAQKTIQVLLYNGLQTMMLTRKRLAKPLDFVGDLTPVYGYENLPRLMMANEVIIAATSAPHLLIKEEHRLLLSGKLLIDFSFPHNIDPALSKNGNFLWDLDYFGAISRRNSQLEQLAVMKAKALCQQASGKIYLQFFSIESFQPKALIS